MDILKALAFNGISVIIFSKAPDLAVFSKALGILNNCIGISSNIATIQQQQQKSSLSPIAVSSCLKVVKFSSHNLCDT